MTVGMTFGNSELYRLRKYYREWIGRTLMAAHGIVPSGSKPTIFRFKDCIDPIEIDDEGRLPFSCVQRAGKVCRRRDKLTCLLVEIRNLIQVWWKCSEKTPGDVEQWLVHLDHVIETWDRQAVVGSVGEGYRLQEKI